MSLWRLLAYMLLFLYPQMNQGWQVNAVLAFCLLILLDVYTRLILNCKQTGSLALTFLYGVRCLTLLSPYIQNCGNSGLEEISRPN